ncbi:sialidase family protein [Sphingobacterium humi]|uniref:Sialidase domain-containing protein n=1 Tax=Sphingobacterium humi TaxID=1796905 RepID=A0A6N8L0U7_9SPHI|nr:sialidase family protein [Sphingobacterium humi]MVZ62976.1 hypothetical protein [Sphingobacterium humi]
MKLSLLKILPIVLLTACGTNKAFTNLTDSQIDWNKKPLHEGIKAYDKSEFIYSKEGKKLFRIQFSEPVVVAVADRPYKWGYFQFPSFYQTDEGHIVARWNLSSDHAESYGKGSSGQAISKDKGNTWQEVAKAPLGGGFKVADHEYIKVHTPVAVPITSLNLSSPIAKAKEAYGRTFQFWKAEDLPDQLKDVHIFRRTADKPEWQLESAKLIEQNLVRYADDKLFPVVWWGDMKQLKDGTLVTGTYPGFTLKNGKVPPSDVPFYTSNDKGKTWTLIGRIPYRYDATLDPKGNQRHALGFTEPTFEILKNGHYLAVLRTTDGLGNSPMYYAQSYDQGKSWTEAAAFTKNGVLPKLQQLQNGAIMLASGRPGMQIRVALNQEGTSWSDPFEMLPYQLNGKNTEVSCSYPDLLQLNKNTFLLIYSDFKFKNEKGETRKAIKVRKIQIDLL